MLLDLRGHPLHTRSLSITLTQRTDGRLDVFGEVLDLRKRGFVPVAGDLQPSGIVHHMMLTGIVDPATLVLHELSASQPTVAFEASAVTLDDGFARRLGEEIGGPRGCSHVLTLAHLLGGTVPWAIAHTRHGSSHRAGERVFRRDVIVDGVEPPGGGLALALQLTDLHLAPAAPLARSMDRFAAAHEVRVLAAVDLGRYVLGDVRIAERRRDAATLDAPWQDRNAEGEGLAGISLARGVSAAIRDRFGERPDDEPLLDGLLMLAPALIQVFAAMSDAWPAMAQGEGWLLGMGGRPDSCWMWRTGGPLQAARAPEDPSTGQV
jgi:Protein of unknown function (DUF2889)